MTNSLNKKRFKSRLKFWPVFLVSAYIFLSGLSIVIYLLLDRFHKNTDVWDDFFPLGFYHWGKLLLIVLSFALIYLAFYLYRRNRMAWILALVVIALQSFINLHHHDNFYLLLAYFFGFILLIIFRKEFKIRNELRNLRQGIMISGIILLIALLYGAFGFWLAYARDFGENLHWGRALWLALREYLLIGSSTIIPKTRQAVWFVDSLHAVGVTSFLIVLNSLFRPLQYHYETLPQERDLARKILHKYKNSCLGYLQLWEDKSFFFSRKENSFVAYVVVGGAALVLGEPVGPREIKQEIIEDFIDYAYERNWSVAFYSVEKNNLDFYKSLNFDSLKIGEQALVEINNFSQKVATKKDFRRLNKIFADYSFESLESPQSPEIINQLAAVSHAWLAIPGRKERTFSVGSFSREYAKLTQLYVLKDKNGKIIAFANCPNSYCEKSISVDMMRYLPTAPNCTMDFLFMKTILACQEKGYEYFDLGLAPLSGLKKDKMTLAERTVAQIYDNLNVFFSFRGLRAYKEKFSPEWKEMFLVYQGGKVGLVKTALALTRAGKVDTI